MEYRKLGNTGLKVSEVGIGCNNFGGRMDQEQTQAVVDKAIDEGINLFDTADVYGGTRSELFLGNALGSRRHDVVVATKFGMGSPDAVLSRGGSRRYIVNAVEASLKRLDTDYIDLYQIHFPDVDTPIEETLRAMSELVTQGKVRYIGCSNFTGWQVADADWTAKSLGLNRFETAQNLYSLMDRRLEREVIPACERFGLGMLPYFPLASGLLTGKYRRGEDAPEGTRLGAMGPRAAQALSDRNFDVVEKLTDFAETRGHTLLELAIGWLASKPVISSVIAGATKPEQVEANVKASGWKFTEEEMNEVNEISRH